MLRSFRADRVAYANCGERGADARVWCGVVPVSGFLRDAAVVAGQHGDRGGAVGQARCSGGEFHRDPGRNRPESVRQGDLSETGQDRPDQDENAHCGFFIQADHRMGKWLAAMLN
jgi:hypothetical protein